MEKCDCQDERPRRPIFDQPTAIIPTLSERMLVPNAFREGRISIVEFPTLPSCPLHSSSHLKPRHEWRLRRPRINPHPLHQVRKVDPHSPHPHQIFPSLRCRVRPLPKLKVFRCPYFFTTAARTDSSPGGTGFPAG